MGHTGVARAPSPASPREPASQPPRTDLPGSPKTQVTVPPTLGLLARLCAGSLSTGQVADAAWPALISAALQHGVAPLLYLKTKQQPIPEAARTELRRLYRGNLARNLALDREGEILQQELQQQADPVIPLKGPHLAVLLYGDPGARQVADLDFLIRPENLAAADRVLAKLNYCRAGPQAADQLKDCRDILYEKERAGGSLACVDLHLRLRPYGRRDALAELIWRDGMSAENLLLYLCLNLMVHRFARLQPLLDVVALVGKENELGWDNVAARAHELEWTAGVFYGLAFASALAGVEIPAQIAALRPRGMDRVWVESLLGTHVDSLLARGKLLDGPCGTLALLGCENGVLAKLRLAAAILFPAAPTLRQMDADGTGLPLPLHYTQRLTRKTMQVAKALVALRRRR